MLRKVVFVHEMGLQQKEKIKIHQNVLSRLTLGQQLCISQSYQVISDILFYPLCNSCIILSSYNKRIAIFFRFLVKENLREQ